MFRIDASTPRLPTLRIALLAFLGLTLSTLGPAFAAPDDAARAWQLDWLAGDPKPALPEIFTAPWGAPRAVTPGLRVALDPVTRLPARPSAEQRRAAAAALAGEHDAAGRTDVPLPTERLRAGGELLHLPEGFQVFVTARRNADGLFTIDCTTDPDTHETIASPPSAPPPAREER